MISSDRPNPLLNWIPHKLLMENNQVLCKWLYISNKRFTEPFFEETISRSLSNSENSKRYKSVSDLETIIQVSEEIEFVQPSAFIFHVSRCGSTLLSQLLCMDESNIVLSEVPLIDEILRLHFKTNNVREKKTEELLLSVIKLLGQKKTGNEKCLFIKLDSWHICFYKTFRKLFPAVPFIFLYRTPDEVIRSHQKLRGMHSVPEIIEPQVFGFSSNEIKDINLDEYLAKVLECYFRNILSITEDDKKTLLLNYKDGGLSMVQAIKKNSGYDLDDRLINEMKKRNQFHSKHPDKKFSEEKINLLVPPYQEKIMELYNQLEEKK